jgi:hypothetical protein
MRALWSLLPCLLSPALWAQVGAGVNTAPPILARVEIDRRNIFDSSEATTALARLANGLHAVTRRTVVSDELLFEPGMAYDSARFAETERNLRALGIFRSVRVDTVSTDSGLVARVMVKDGWSTRPDVGFRSSGGDVAYSLELLEDNLLGTSATANIVHRREPDRRSTSFVARHSRLIARKVSVGAGYAPGSDGHRWNFDMAVPFRTIATRSAASLELVYEDRRAARFHEGVIVPGDSSRRRLFTLKASAGLALRASSRGYVRAGIAAVLNRDRLQETLDQAGPRRTTVTAGPSIGWTRARYGMIRGFRSVSREEDVDLSTSLSAGAMLALRGWGHSRDGVIPSLSAQTGAVIPRGFLVTAGTASGHLSAGGLDSASFNLSGTFGLRPHPRHLLLVHSELGAMIDPAPGSEFDLGLEAGPRGFVQHAFTGDRKILLTAEYRWTAATDLFKAVAVGLAGFVDGGGAWFAESSPHLGTSIGFGLRLDSPREARGNLFRLDLARTFPGGDRTGRWALVVAKGLAF